MDTQPTLTLTPDMLANARALGVTVQPTAPNRVIVRGPFNATLSVMSWVVMSSTAHGTADEFDTGTRDGYMYVTALA